VKPVEQTKFDLSFGESKSNHISACLASLVEVPIDSVPKFEEMSESEMKLTMAIWLKSIGYIIEFHNSSPLPRISHMIEYIAIDRTQFGKQHAVIKKEGNVIHNPHPDKIEIFNTEEFWFIIKSSN